MPESKSNTRSTIDRMIDVARGVAETDPVDLENRGTRRCEHEALVALVQWTPNGGKSISTVVQCKNMSPSGMCIVSRYMLHVGHEGVLLLQRSNAENVILGIKVIYCKYVGGMKHESGIKFVEVPTHFSMEDFRDEQGNMPRLGSRQAA